jgi:hypothetical protein
VRSATNATTDVLPDLQLCARRRPTPAPRPARRRPAGAQGLPGLLLLRSAAAALPRGPVDDGPTDRTAAASRSRLASDSPVNSKKDSEKKIPSPQPLPPSTHPPHLIGTLAPSRFTGFTQSRWARFLPGRLWGGSCNLNPFH